MQILKNKFSKLFKDYWQFILIIAIFAVFFYPVWLGKIPLPADALVAAHVPYTEVKWEGYPAGVPFKNLEISDTFSQFYIWKSFAGESWRMGKVPLWNPYMFSGTPFLATLHSSVFYPLNILYTIFSDQYAWTALIGLQVLLSLIFMYVFLRRLGLSSFPSLFGSVAFSFSGYMISLLEFTKGGQSGLWFPLLLTFGLNLFQSKRILWLVPISLVFFFIFSAGDFQTPIYILATYGLLGIFFSISQKSFKPFWLSVVSIILGVCLSAIQILPTLDLYKNSVRVKDSYVSEYNYGLLGWEKVTNFIWPDFHGNVVTGNYQGKYSYHEYMAYVGILALFFVAYSLLSKKSFIEKFFWTALVISLFLLFPNPIGYLPYKLGLPALSTSFASRILFLTDFCMAVLSAYGFQKFIDSKNRKLGVLLGIGLFLLVSVPYVVLTFLLKQPNLNSTLNSIYSISQRNIILSIIISALFLTYFYLTVLVKGKLSFKKYLTVFILCLSLFDLLRFSWKNTPFSERRFVFPETSILKFLKDAEKPFRIVGGIPTNIFMQFDIESAEGYDPIYPFISAELISVINNGDLDSPSGRYGLIGNYSSPFLNLANVKYIVDYKKGPAGDINKDGSFNQDLLGKNFKLVHQEGRVSIFENKNVYPRVWISRDYKVEKTPTKLIEELSNSLTDKKLTVYLEENFEGFSDRSLNVESKVNKYDQDINTIQISYESSKSVLLFLSETYDSGWKAFVDEKESKVFKSNYSYMSVLVPQGNHSVRLVYDPDSFKLGQMVSLGGLIIIFVISLNSFLKRKK